MYFLYILALLAILTGGILWYKDKNITLYEWLIGGGAALVLAIIFNIIVVVNIHSKTDDVETWSGRITAAKHFAAWDEYYEYAVYRTEYYTVSVSNSNGKGSHTETRSRQVFDHWQPTTRHHYDIYQILSDLDTTYDIDLNKFNYFVKKFGQKVTVEGIRTTFSHNSRMIGGDPNDYEARNINNWVEPVTKLVHFENRIKATPNLFQFSKIPTNILVYNWPDNPDWNRSDRLIGTSLVLIDNLKFDQLNSCLGFSKKVNLIMVGFGDKGAEYGQYQQAKFIGGRKNDLVICFGGGSKTKPATWAYVFGFTEKDIVKQNIQTILLNNPINDDILAKIQDEVRKNYTIKDWKKFNYITVQPNPSIYVWYIVLMIIIQFVLYVVFDKNDVKKNRWTR